jgi:hypothetical protein
VGFVDDDEVGAVDRELVPAVFCLMKSVLITRYG